MSNLDFTEFNKKFFVKTKAKISWFNRKGTMNVKKGIMAEVTVVTHGTCDHYDGYSVKILNKEGQLSSHYFSFTEGLVLKPDSRTDINNKFQIIGHCCDNGQAEWYIQKPTGESVDDMAKQIINYIKQYENL